MIHGAVVLATYSRPERLIQCLDSIAVASERAPVMLVIVVQDGNHRVKYIAQRAAKDFPFATILEVNRIGSTPLEAMNLNYWIAFRTAFSNPDIEWALSVEEESVISVDALAFVDAMFQTYGARRSFRGVNLISREVDPSLRKTYSLLRWGHVGGAGMLTRDSWRRIEAANVQRRLAIFPFDGSIERIMKTGFVVHPNLAKCMNFGWDCGTHLSDAESIERYKALETSWSIADVGGPYKHKDIRHSWRMDMKPFRRLKGAPHYMRYLVAQLLNNSWGDSVKRYRSRSAFSRKVLQRQASTS